MLIEVKETHPPKAANRSGTVVTMDGQKLDCWPPMLSRIQVGQRYDVETTTNDRGYTSIKKATPVNGAAPAAAPPTAPAPTMSGEGEYVGHIIAAKILKGDIQDKQLASFTARLRQIWRETDPTAQPYDQAAE